MSGKKESKGKIDFTLIDPVVLEEVAEILTTGGRKYGDKNYQNVNQNEYEKALCRHLNKHLQGEKNDKQSKKLHISHVIANGIFVAWHEKNGGSAIEEE